MNTVSDRPGNLMPELIRRQVRIAYRDDGGTVTSYDDDNGEICSTVYQLYPGISLIRKDVHRPNFISNWRHNPKEVLNIEHCREGRMECSMGKMYFTWHRGILWCSVRTMWCRRRGIR